MCDTAQHERHVHDAHTSIQILLSRKAMLRFRFQTSYQRPLALSRLSAIARLGICMHACFAHHEGIILMTFLAKVAPPSLRAAAPLPESI